MSLNQMKKVFDDTTIKGNKKLIMLAIADNANDSGVAFPSWNSLMKKCSMSRGSLSDNMKILEEEGYLFKKNRSRKNGGRSSNKYLIYPMENRDNLDEEDYLIFEDLYSKSAIQSSETELGGQSSETELGSKSQSSETELECEQSLNSLTITKKNKQKKDDDFKQLLKRLINSSVLKSKASFTTKGAKLFEAIGKSEDEVVIAYLAHYNSQTDVKFAKRVASFLENWDEVTGSTKTNQNFNTPEEGSIDWHLMQQQNQQANTTDVEVLDGN